MRSLRRSSSSRSRPQKIPVMASQESSATSADHNSSSRSLDYQQKSSVLRSWKDRVSEGRRRRGRRKGGGIGIKNKMSRGMGSLGEFGGLSSLGEYEGDFDGLGRRDGSGRMTYHNGNVYLGDWRRGFRHGHGSVRFANGALYEGEWADDSAHGHGVHRYSNGAIYDGGWLEGRMHGFGTFHSTDGRMEIKRYEKGKPIGEGVRWSKDRRTAWRMDGYCVTYRISLESARAIAKRLGSFSDARGDNVLKERSEYYWRSLKMGKDEGTGRWDVDIADGDEVWESPGGADSDPPAGDDLDDGRETPGGREKSEVKEKSEGRERPGDENAEVEGYYILERFASWLGLGPTQS